MSMKLQIPSENPNFNHLLSVTPMQFFQQGDISVVQPILRQLMFGNMSQLVNYPNQLLQVIQLLQLTLQYFTFAQETYAQQCEQNQIFIKKLQQDNAVLQNQVNLLNLDLQQRKNEKQATPAFVFQMQAIKEANEMIIRENYQLKEQMKKMAQIIVPPDLPTCQFCNKKFTTKDYLAQHIRNKHKEKYKDFIKEKGEQNVHKYKEMPQNIDFTLSTQRPKREMISSQLIQPKQPIGPENLEKSAKPEQEKQNNLSKPVGTFVQGPTPYELEKQIDMQDFEQIQMNFDQIKNLLDNYKEDVGNSLPLNFGSGIP